MVFVKQVTVLTSSPPSSPDFDQLANLFWQLGVMQSPAQLQAYLLGLLAVSDALELNAWLQQAQQLLDPVRPLEPEENALLAAMLASHRRALSQDDLDLQLLLPDDNEDITQRIDAVGQWSQGFLLGFAHAGKQLQAERGSQSWPQEVSETLSDMAAISQIGVEEELDIAESEQQLFEISEYLRLAAINIAMECRQMAAKPARPADKKLH